MSHLGRTAVAALLLSAAGGAVTAHAATPAPTAPSWGCPLSAAPTVTCINGGGSTASQNAYVGASRVVSSTLTFQGGELWQYATANPAIGFSYEGGQSVPAQTALLNNLPSNFTGNTLETGYAVHFAASESYVTSTSPLWAYVGPNHPMPSGGQFIQIPMWGTLDVIPVNNAKMTYNGAVALTDNDLCGIFSGNFRNWNQTSVAAKLTAGTIKVYWRADNGGASASFQLTQHLAAVCGSLSGTRSGFVFSKTSKFAQLFPSFVTPPNDGKTAWAINALADGSFNNFVPVTNSAGMADGVNNDATGSAIGYVSPDYSAIAAAPILSSKSKQYNKLFVASLINKNNNVAYLPTVTNINLALTNPGAAANLNPPSLTNGVTAPATQTNWVPVITTPVKGYPIVGYSILDLPQCYADHTIANAMIQLLTNHVNGIYKAELQDSGFVPTLAGASSGWGAAVYRTFVTNLSGLNLNINNVTACKGVTGR